MKKCLAYYRVSTGKQKRSGLGLEAQQDAVHSYCKFHKLKLIDELEEVRSTRKNRPVLQRAFELCKAKNAILIVACLDRLGRDVEEIAHNVKLPVDIIIVDNPQANRFTVHILAAVAEEQRRTISVNTKAALQAAKRKGIILGKNGKRLAEKNKKMAFRFAMKMKPIVINIRKEGYSTVQSITDQLNLRKIPTFRSGSRWHKSTVHKMMNYLK